MKIFKLPVLFVFLALATSTFAQKLTAEEIVAKHLDSIATKEKRAELKSIVATGTLQFKVVRAPNNQGSKSAGKVVIISEANKSYFGAKLDSPFYPHEEIVSDGNKFIVAFIQPGQRSVLGNFVFTNNYIIDEGLLGGDLSTAWSLFNWEARKAKLKNAGKKKIDGRETYIVSYIGKSNTLFSIKFYFDAETFQLLRTEHYKTFPRPVVTDPAQSSSQVTTTHKLTEDFSNYKQVSGLTLPHSYKMSFLINGKETHEYDWNIEFAEFAINQKIDPVTFETK